MHRPGMCGVGKFLDRVDNAAPDGGALVIAGGRELVGPLGAFVLGLFAVALKHEVRDAPDVDLDYHTGRLEADRLETFKLKG